MPPKRQAAEAAASEASTKKPKLAPSTKEPAPVTPAKKIKCSYKGCSVTRDCPSHMKVHVDSVHLKIKQHSCPEKGCDKAYTTTSELGVHIRQEHQGVKFPCPVTGCDKVYARAGSLAKHTKNIHEGVTFPCFYDDYQKSYTRKDSLDRHVQSEHDGLRHHCNIEACQKVYSNKCTLTEHIQSAHHSIRYICPYEDCEKMYTERRSRIRHIRAAHQGVNFPCPYPQCQKTYIYKQTFDQHVKSAHGTPEEEADMLQKRLELQQFLADKEGRGVCSFTRSCENLAAEGSFRCLYHQRTVNILTSTLEEKRIAGKLSASSITSSDEFALLLQRPKLSLDPAAKASLRLLAQGLDDVHGSSTIFLIDIEFAWVGLFLPLDITIMRLNGEVVISTRVDHSISIKDLIDLCPHPISRACVYKVYGKSDKT